MNACWWCFAAALLLLLLSRGAALDPNADADPTIRFSPNGQYAAKVPIDSLDTSILLQNVNTGSEVKIERLLPQQPTRLAAAVAFPSNDGNIILFSWQDRAGKGCAVGVLNVGLAQRYSLSELSDSSTSSPSLCEAVSLSADARMAAFVDASGALRLARLDPAGRLESLLDDRTLAHLSGVAAKHYLVTSEHEMRLVAFDTPISIDFEQDTFYHRDVYMYDRAVDRFVWISNFPERADYLDCDLSHHHGSSLSVSALLSDVKIVFSCWQNENYRLFYAQLDATKEPARLAVRPGSAALADLETSFLLLEHVNNTPANTTTAIGGSPNAASGIQPGAIAALAITLSLLLLIGIALFLSTYKNGSLLASKADPPTATTMPMSPGPIHVYEDDSDESDYSYEDAMGQSKSKRNQDFQNGPTEENQDEDDNDDDDDLEIYRHKGSEYVDDDDLEEAAAPISTTRGSARPAPIPEESDESNSEWEPPATTTRPTFQPFAFNRRNTPKEVAVEVPADAFVKKRKENYRAQRKLSVASEAPPVTEHSSLRNLKAPPGSEHERLQKVHKSAGSLISPDKKGGKSKPTQSPSPTLKATKKHTSDLRLVPSKQDSSREKDKIHSEPTTPAAKSKDKSAKSIAPRSNQSAEAAIDLPFRRSSSKEKNTSVSKESSSTSMQRSASGDSKMLKIHLPHKKSSKKQNIPQDHGNEAYYSHREGSSSRTTSRSDSAPKTSRSDGAIPHSSRAPPSSSRSSASNRTPTKKSSKKEAARTPPVSDSDSDSASDSDGSL